MLTSEAEAESYQVTVMKVEESDTFYHTIMYLDLLAWVAIVSTFCAAGMQLATGVPLTTLFTLYIEDDYLEGDLPPVSGRIGQRG